MKPKRQVAAAALRRPEQIPTSQYILNSMSASFLEAFADEPSRAILNSTITRCKSIEEVAQENHIPISTAYRRAHLLVNRGLLMVERMVITQGGKRYSLFRSTMQGAKLDLQPTGFQVTCAPNQSVPDISFRIWRFSNRDSDPTAMV